MDFTLLEHNTSPSNLTERSSVQPPLSSLQLPPQHVPHTPPQPILAQTHIKKKKKLSRKKLHSQILKDYILKIKHTRRVELLREQTSTNIQMFLRIKAQESHYKLRSIPRDMSCQLPTKIHKVEALPTSRPATTTTTFRLRCQSAKSNLVSKCSSLKDSLAQETSRVQGLGETRVFRQVSGVRGKENQGVSVNRYGGNEQLQKKVVARKLGLRSEELRRVRIPKALGERVVVANMG